MLYRFTPTLRMSAKTLHGGKEQILTALKKKKRLDVAIVGAPNAGKSQLLNVLTKSPVAAVSRKRHTTRTDILGARTIGDTQIVFKDTPGYLRVDDAKEERLNRDLIISAASEIQNVDFSLLVVDAARTLTENYRHAIIQLMLHAIRSKGRIEEDDQAIGTKALSDFEWNRSRFAIVLNKVDLVKPKTKLLDLAMELGAMADACLLDEYRESSSDPTKENPIEINEGELDFESLLEVSPICFYVSAKEEDGTEDIVDHLLELATPCNVWAVDSDSATDMSSEERIQELIREKIYRCLHREVPHSIVQECRLFRRVPQGVIIHQDLIVFTKSHHRLVLGRGGKTLQRIQETSARDLRGLFGCDVMLQLRVKMNTSKQRRNPEDYASVI